MHVGSIAAPKIKVIDGEHVRVKMPIKKKEEKTDAK